MKGIQSVQNQGTTPPVASPPPVDPDFFIQNLLSIAGYATCGMWRAAMAFLKNYSSNQENSMDMMHISQAIEDSQMAAGKVLIADIQTQQGNINDAITAYGVWMSKYESTATSQQLQDAHDNLQNAITTAQGQSTIYNTKYTSVNQFWSGLDNGVNQTSADETQTQSLDMQMFQQGLLSLEQQLANAL